MIREFKKQKKSVHKFDKNVEKLESRILFYSDRHLNIVR